MTDSNIFSCFCRKPQLDKTGIFENVTLDPLSVSETVVNIETPKNHIRK